MHTEEDLTKKFVSKKDHPIWYYKELESVDIDYVIMNLLKENFAVEINNHKYEVTFGVDKSDEIGFSSRYDEFNHEFISSYDILNKGFKEGKWFVVINKNTSHKFKENYDLKLKKYEEEQKIQCDKEILANFINIRNDINKKEKDRLIEYINNCSVKKRESFVKELFKNINNN